MKIQITQLVNNKVQTATANLAITKSSGYYTRYRAHVKRDICRDINICQHTCWCEFCKNPIKKGELFFNFFKNGHMWGSYLNKWRVSRGSLIRVNICLYCLQNLWGKICGASKDAKRKTLTAIRKRLMLKKLEEHNGHQEY